MSKVIAEHNGVLLPVTFAQLQEVFGGAPHITRAEEMHVFAKGHLRHPADELIGLGVHNRRFTTVLLDEAADERLTALHISAMRLVGPVGKFALVLAYPVRSISNKTHTYVSNLHHSE